MHEDLTFVDRLHRELGAVRWPEPAELRARARRRSRRTAMSAAVAVLVVASGSAYAVAGERAGLTGQPARQPVASAPEPPPVLTRAEIPQDALLSARDVRGANAVVLGDAGFAEPIRIDPVLRSCGREREVPAPGPTSRASRSRTFLGAPAGRAPTTAVLSQDVYRVDPAQAELLFGEIGLLLNACRRWRPGDTGGATDADRPTPAGKPIVATPSAGTDHGWEKSASNFAGDRSVMVRHVALDPPGRPDRAPAATDRPSDITMVVEVGDLVTVIVPGSGTVADRTDDPGLSYQDLEKLGRTAAARLCRAANPSC